MSQQTFTGKKDINKELFKFSLLMAAVILLLTFWLSNTLQWMLVASVIAVTLITLGKLKSHWLLTPYRAWMKFGELLGSVVNPILLGIVFFGIVTPIAWLRGKGRIETAWDKDATSYRSSPDQQSDLRDPF